MEAYSRGLRRAPDDPQLLRGAAKVAMQLGLWDEALARLERARELDPRSYEIHGSLGRTLLYLRRHREAHEAFDRALDLAPANVFLLQQKAMVYLAEGRLPEARR